MSSYFMAKRAPKPSTPKRSMVLGDTSAIAKVSDSALASAGTITEGKFEYIYTQSATIPNWNNTFTIRYDTLNTIVREQCLMFEINTISNALRFTPAQCFIERVDYMGTGGALLQTVSGQELFISTQLFNSDEDRALINTLQGHYASTTQRNNMASGAGSNKFYVPLISYVNSENGVAVLNSTQFIELKVTLKPLDSCVGGSSGTVSAPFVGCTLISRVQRIPQDLCNTLVKNYPLQVKFSEARFQSISVSASLSQANYVLQSITGKVAFLFFVYQETSKQIGDFATQFAKIPAFTLLDGNGQNLCGGVQVTDEVSQLLCGRWWTSSSYLSETNNGITSNGAHVMIYSFCESPELALSGIRCGYQPFKGNEQLTVNWVANGSGNSGSGGTLNVYAYVYSKHVTADGGVKKVE